MPLPVNACEQCNNVFAGNQCPVCNKVVENETNEGGENSI